MNSYAVPGVLFRQSFPVEPPSQDVQVRRGRPSNASYDQEIRIQTALDHVFSQPGVQQILSAEGPTERDCLQSVIKKALQDYSLEHGVLKLVANIRAQIGDCNKSGFLVDHVPVSLLHCRIHGVLEENGLPSEVSGSTEVKSHELGRLILSRQLSCKPDHLGRKNHLLNIQCELAPNVYESPISALVLGVSHDVFLYHQLAEVLNRRTLCVEDPQFTVKVSSGLDVPERFDFLRSALQKLEMRVFEQAIKLAYNQCTGTGTAERCLTAPVSNMMLYKAQYLRHDVPLGVALQKYLRHPVSGYPSHKDITKLFDLFQADIRVCRAASAPLAAIGRAYFNAQFRNLICEAGGLVKPEDVASFELRVRAHREARTEGVQDAPINNALLNRLWRVAPKNAVNDVQAILSQSSGSETMVFEFEELS